VYPKTRTLLTKKRTFRSFLVGDDKFIQNGAISLKLSEVSRINVELSEFKEAPSEKSKKRDIALFDEFFETEEQSKNQSIEPESPTKLTQEKNPVDTPKESSIPQPQLPISSPSTSGSTSTPASVELTASTSMTADISQVTYDGSLEHTNSMTVVANVDDGSLEHTNSMTVVANVDDGQRQAADAVRVEDTMEGLEETGKGIDGKGDEEAADAKIASEAVKDERTYTTYSETSTEDSISELEGPEPNNEFIARGLDRYQKTELTSTQLDTKSNLKTQSVINKVALEIPTLQSISESSIKGDSYTPYWSEVKTLESTNQRSDDSSHSPVKISTGKIESNKAHPFRPIGNPIASIPIDNI
jgi:hypothetical protein